MSIDFTEDQIVRAATAMKALTLAKIPGMDEVAVKLNCEPNYSELKEARQWAVALGHATHLRPFDLAHKVKTEVR